jgi:hypothetical protein
LIETERYKARHRLQRDALLAKRLDLVEELKNLDKTDRKYSKTK